MQTFFEGLSAWAVKLTSHEAVAVVHAVSICMSMSMRNHLSSALGAPPVGSGSRPARQPLQQPRQRVQSVDGHDVSSSEPSDGWEDPAAVRRGQELIDLQSFWRRRRQQNELLVEKRGYRYVVGYIGDLFPLPRHLAHLAHLTQAFAEQ